MARQYLGLAERWYALNSFSAMFRGCEDLVAMLDRPFRQVAW